MQSNKQKKMVTFASESEVPDEASQLNSETESEDRNSIIESEEDESLYWENKLKAPSSSDSDEQPRSRRKRKPKKVIESLPKKQKLDNLRQDLLKLLDGRSIDVMEDYPEYSIEIPSLSTDKEIKLLKQQFLLAQLLLSFLKADRSANCKRAIALLQVVSELENTGDLQREILRLIE